MITIDDITLKNAKNGDVQAFEEIMRNYEKLVYSISYRMLENTEDASDIFQDVFIRVYKNISTCKDINHLKCWIARVTSNACIDVLRKRKTRPTESLDEINDNEYTTSRKNIYVMSDYKTPEDSIINKERRQYLINSINKLSSDDKAIIILRDIHGLSYDELSKVTSQNLGTVKSRLSRARQKLKKILTETVTT